jgi:hypothetical protein
MRHLNPSVAKEPLAANKNASRAKGACSAGKINQAGAEGSLAYARLVVSRCSQGLLEPFRCAICGLMALDPIGWNGPGQPLCAGCADPVETRSE